MLSLLPEYKINRYRMALDGNCFHRPGLRMILQPLESINPLTLRSNL